MNTHTVYVSGYGFNQLSEADQAVLLNGVEPNHYSYRVLTAENLLQLSPVGLNYAIEQIVDHYRDCEVLNLGESRDSSW